MTNKAVPKIEGHATFYTHLKNGRVDKARIIGLDGERFVEKILVGRKYYQAPVITSRICGICPVIHSTTSTRAMEAAVGITASKQTETLRELLLCGQMIQSHSLHLYLLVAPDYVGVSSSFELQKDHPEIFSKAVELKKYADLIVEVTGGRAVHPVSNVVGGFKKLPSVEDLKKISKQYDEIVEIAEETVRFFASLLLPEVKREIIYSALFDTKKYAYYSGDVKTTAGNLFKAENYTNYVYEELVPYNRAKFATLQGKTMMVGAIARYSINRNKLNKRVIDLLDELKIKSKFDNPFENILAQAIENYHFVIESKDIINYLFKEGLKKENVKEPKNFGKGTSACEAPRGTLFHHYEVDSDGYITKCDVITPTVQFLPAIEYDMKNIAPLLKGKKKNEQTEIVEMLIRAFDPCITCATH